MRYFDGRAWAPPAPVFERRPPHQELPLPAAIGALLVLLVSLVFGRSLVALFADSDGTSDLIVSVVVGYGPSLVWCWYVLSRWTDRRLRSIGWEFRWGDLWRGPATYFTAIGIQIVLAALLLLLDVPITSNVDDGDGGRSTAYVVAIVIVTVVAAPVVEEIVFRGVVLRGLLSRMGAAPAIAIQGVLFGIAHVDPSRGAGNVGLAVVLSSVGIVLGAGAYLTRRIGPTVIAHAIFNGVVMIIVLSGVLDDVDTELGIVDQANVTEPHRHDDHGSPIDLGDRLERLRIDDLDVLRPGTRLAGEHSSGDADQGGRVALARRVQVDG
jgi:membrane protease YdiL (CAAX protease family)